MTIKHVIYKGREIPAARLLMALYRRAPCVTIGTLHYRDGDLSEEDAQRILDMSGAFNFDYLHGRCMKVFFGDPMIETKGDTYLEEGVLFDASAGHGAFAEAIEEACMSKPDPNALGHDALRHLKLEAILALQSLIKETAVLQLAKKRPA